MTERITGLPGGNLGRRRAPRGKVWIATEGKGQGQGAGLLLRLGSDKGQPQFAGSGDEVTSEQNYNEQLIYGKIHFKHK